jgi:hypothetical protein
MKVLTFGVFLCVIFIFSSVVSGTIITDTYGNEAYGNGTRVYKFVLKILIV